MGKRINKWLQKQDRLRLQAGWGKPDKKADQPPPVHVMMANKPNEVKAIAWCNAVQASFQPKPIPVSKSPLSCSSNYTAWLEKRGFKRLGQGCYSTVYAKGDSDRVLKVTRASQDDWIDYIQWAAKKGYCGTFAPRVYSWKKYPAGFSVSVVERMECTLHGDAAGDMRIVERLMYDGIQKKNLMAQVYMDDLVPGIVPFLSDLTAEFDSNDIYGKNMMLRKDGSFCVTDPVCGQSQTTINRLRSRDFTSLAPANLGLFYAKCEAYFRS